MRKFLFTFILSSLTGSGFADSQLTDHAHEIDYSGQSDSFICSWFQVVPVPEDFIKEAKKRGLSCGSTTYYTNKKTTNKKRDIPRNATGTASNWKCKPNYVRRAGSCLTAIANGVWSNDGLSITCASGYKLTGQKCKRSSSSSASSVSSSSVTRVSTSYYHNGSECVRNFRRSGDKCIYKIKVPKNAFASTDPDGWTCNSGYTSNGIYCLKVPPNASVDPSDVFNGWSCNIGYRISYNNEKCLKIIKIPENAYASGESWKCNSGYEKSGNSCIIKIPPNATAHTYGSGWKCNDGFYKSNSGTSCIIIKIPKNAYASGSGWKCNPGFERQGNSCNQIEDDTIYQAGSGSGFATSKEGHILTNHHVIDGCSEVTLFKNGKSYLTTVVTQDPNNDLAILLSDFKPTKVYSLSNEVYLSLDIFAAGFPFGKKISSGITINKGIISALMGPGDDISIFQIDADINSGNSGGPIVDKRGNAVGIAVAKLNAERAKEELKLGSIPEGFNFAVNSMMAIGLFRSQGIDIPPQNNNELSVKDRNDLFNQGTFYLSCGMTIAQYEKMIKTDKVMFTRDVFFSNFEGN